MSKKPLKKTDADKPWARRNGRGGPKRLERRYILVASEDAKSSVYYFAEFAKRLSANAATIGIIPKGVGRNTQGLVRYVRENIPAWIRELNEDYNVERFDDLWILFDKDDFPAHRFDNAIVSAQKQGYKVAWSNECFELWYLLHLKDRATPMAREEIFREMTPLCGSPDYATECKGAAGEAFHRQMAHHPAVHKALSRAKKIAVAIPPHTPPHAANPCTMVFGLVEFLLMYL